MQRVIYAYYRYTKTLQTLILNKVNMATFHLAINYLKLNNAYYKQVRIPS